jgi:hypothetical protein
LHRRLRYGVRQLLPMHVSPHRRERVLTSNHHARALRIALLGTIFAAAWSVATRVETGHELFAVALALACVAGLGSAWSP